MKFGSFKREWFLLRTLSYKLWFQYTTPLATETVTNFTTAEAKCMQWGARLFQPRSTQGLTYFGQAEQLHMGQNLFKFNGQSSYLAIGLTYQQLTGDTQPFLYYRWWLTCALGSRLIILVNSLHFSLTLYFHLKIVMAPRYQIWWLRPLQIIGIPAFLISLLEVVWVSKIWSLRIFLVTAPKELSMLSQKVTSNVFQTIKKSNWIINILWA